MHTPHAILCGDFNLEASEPEYALITASGWYDAWHVLHGTRPQDPTFRLVDRRYGPDPIACDFVFVSDGLAAKVSAIEVDGLTQASDHQPVMLQIG